MDKEVIALARYYLDADRLEAGETALPLTYEELKQLADDVQDLAREIHQAVEDWFELRRRLAATRRAFKS